VRAVRSPALWSVRAGLRWLVAGGLCGAWSGGLLWDAGPVRGDDHWVTAPAGCAGSSLGDAEPCEGGSYLPECGEVVDAGRDSDRYLGADPLRLGLLGIPHTNGHAHARPPNNYERLRARSQVELRRIPDGTHEVAVCEAFSAQS
jgi:hypothetical protein